MAPVIVLSDVDLLRASGFEDVEAAELAIVAFADVVLYQIRFPWVNVASKTMFWSEPYTENGEDVKSTKFIVMKGQ